MSTLFATGFISPVRFGSHTVQLSLAIPPGLLRPVYFEREYVGADGNTIGIRATLITSRGYVCLTDAGDLPTGTVRVLARVTGENRATLADASLPEAVNQTAYTRFATGFESPVMFGARQLNLSLFFSDNARTAFLERRYLDAGRRQITIRSEAIYKRADLITFNLNNPAPPAGTRWIETTLRSNYTGLPETAEGFGLEYEYLEYEPLEYN